MKYTREKAPFTLGSLKFNHINLLIQASLLAVFVSSFVIYNNNGHDATNLIINGIIAVVTSFIVEYIYWKVSGKFVSFRKLMIKEIPLVIPLTIVLLMPLHVNFFVIVIATIVGVFIGKLAYGGYGFSIFNPAVVGALFAQISFKIPLLEGITYPIQALKQATAEMQFAGLNVNELLFGGYYGLSVGSASALLLLIIIVLLSIFKAIDWRTSLAYLVTVFGIAFVMGKFEFAIEHVLSGSVLFAAAFLVTEQVTSPTSRETKIVFAVIVGLLTMMIRTIGTDVDGVLYAVLIGNIFTPLMNRTVKRSNLMSLVKALVFAIVVIVAAGASLNYIVEGRAVVELIIPTMEVMM